MRTSGTSYRHWHLAAVILSLAALAAVIVGTFLRLAQPLAFCLTMFGLLCLARPAWDRPENRKRIAAINAGLFLAQVAILCSDLAASS